MSPAVGVDAADIAKRLVLLGRRMQDYGAAVIQGDAHPLTALQLAAAMDELAADMRTPVPDEEPVDEQLAAAAQAAIDAAPDARRYGGRAL